MLIDVYPVAQRFQPDHQNFMSPPHNADYGVEQDFYVWLMRNRQYVTGSIEQADVRYIPVYFNRYYINNAWGQEGVGELAALLAEACSVDKPCFTVCEYDIRDMQPAIVPDNLIVMVASRRGTDWRNIDIPLLCSPHTTTRPAPEKRSLAFFAGNANTFGIRIEMAEALEGKPGMDILRSGELDTPGFVYRLLSSYVALSPRGHGGSSFRFYEAMQLGVVPLHIGEPDVRPFPNGIDWSICSLYRKDNDGIFDYLNSLDLDDLLRMGKAAQNIYNWCLQYGRWEALAIEELEILCQRMRG